MSTLKTTNIVHPNSASSNLVLTSGGATTIGAVTHPTTDGSSRQTLITNGSGALSFQWDAGSLFYRLNADLAGSNVITAQSVFGVGVTLASSTVYVFDALYIFAKTAGINSHILGVGFGGSATVNNFQSFIVGNFAASAQPATLTAPQVAITNSVANINVYGSGTASATATWLARMSGTVSVNAGGTFIPQYTLSALPGGAYSTVAGSYIKFTPIGAAGSASSQGAWS